jgi:hypothetical protein
MRRGVAVVFVVGLLLLAAGGGSASAMVVGFTIEKSGQVRRAARLGITDDLLYGSRSAKLEAALAGAGVGVIDGRISSELADWECHRTHTVAPPPPGWRPYCATDAHPGVNSPAVVLEAVEGWLREDAAIANVAGYWVLDDWPPWDGGTARQLLGEIHGAIERITPGRPAICGFGGSIEDKGRLEGFESSAAENFSSEGCSMVALYNYAVWGKEPSNGDEVEWGMGILLHEQMTALAAAGWNESETPLLGIGQAFSGPFGIGEYEQGLTTAQMLEQAKAFCSAGATSLGWYAWGDSNYVHGKLGTQTPVTSKAIRQGIEASIKACGL